MWYPRIHTFLPALAFLLLQGCTDAVAPEFHYILGLPYIDAVVGTTPGTSYVQISESARDFGVNLNKPVSGATVSFINTQTGKKIGLTELDDAYLPPEGFAAKVGETWELEVLLPNGKRYLSEPEKINEAIPISRLEVTYDPQLYFSDEFDSYIPGHRISVDFSDPGGTPNYYYWRYRSFERLVYCRQCFGRTVLRGGECIVINFGNEQDESILKDYYTYACEERCWQIRYSEKIDLFSDEFTDGAEVTNLPVADIPLHTKRNVLVELQQFALSEKAYKYYRTLKDLIDNNSGFNAPLPAALVGNLYNPDEPEEVVLGRFTAAATSVMPIFIERINIEEEQLEPIIVGQAEGLETPAPQVFYAPCINSRYRTTSQPEGWRD